MYICIFFFLWLWVLPLFSVWTCSFSLCIRFLSSSFDCPSLWCLRMLLDMYRYRRMVSYMYAFIPPVHREEGYLSLIKRLLNSLFRAISLGNCPFVVLICSWWLLYVCTIIGSFVCKSTNKHFERKYPIEPSLIEVIQVMSDEGWRSKPPQHVGCFILF